MAPFRKMIAALGMSAMVAAVSAHAAGDPVRGEEVYEGCKSCHAIDANEIGPMHRGVVGRKAASVPGYRYSPALKGANIVWTEENLDKWLAGPDKMVPGTKMFYELDEAQDRADVIAYLKAKAS